MGKVVSGTRGTGKAPADAVPPPRRGPFSGAGCPASTRSRSDRTPPGDDVAVDQRVECLDVPIMRFKASPRESCSTSLSPQFTTRGQVGPKTLWSPSGPSTPHLTRRTEDSRRRSIHLLIREKRRIYLAQPSGRDHPSPRRPDGLAGLEPACFQGSERAEHVTTCMVCMILVPFLSPSRDELPGAVRW